MSVFTPHSRKSFHYSIPSLHSRTPQCSIQLAADLGKERLLANNCNLSNLSIASSSSSSSSSSSPKRIWIAKMGASTPELRRQLTKRSKLKKLGSNKQKQLQRRRRRRCLLQSSTWSGCVTPVYLRLKRPLNV